VTHLAGGCEPKHRYNDAKMEPTVRYSLQVSLILALALVCGGCARREVRVKDVTKSETIILKKASGQGSITGLSITGRGSIAGKAEVQLILNGAVYKKEEVHDDVSFVWGGDWYADQAEVRYSAGPASGGSLTLRYEFHDL
jgi:hypothetical protein